MNQASSPLLHPVTAVIQAVSSPVHLSALARQFLDGEASTKRYVVGRNEQAADLHSVVTLDGVIDDFEKIASHWHGVPIVRMRDVPVDALVANCSTSISPVAVEAALQQHGVVNIVGIHELIDAAGGRLPLPWFVRQQREDLVRHIDTWRALYERMADAKSQETLLDVLRYRVTADARFMRNYRVRLLDQYFEEFVNLGSEVFVDAGGFDGDTTAEFVKRCPSYRRVYFFEPAPSNIDAAKKRLASFRDIDFRQVGLSDQRGELSFDPNAGSASAVTQSGSQKIEVITLDEAVSEPVTFIKMDLEGWELKALAGCAEHIRRERPKLAIAVYHAARDFRAVFDFVLSLHPTYKVYLRHYTQGWSETVMYFV